MGNLSICVYAILFFGYFERTIIIRKHKRKLIFYKQKIDNVLGFCIDTPENLSAWNDFQSDMNITCKLNWTFVQPTTSVNFLDITIYINLQGYIYTKTYQTSMNLFLYILPQSAHPLGLMKFLIYGLLPA